MSQAVRKKLQKRYGPNSDVVYMPEGFSGDHIEHYAVFHDNGTSFHDPKTGRKKPQHHVWAQEKPKKSRLRRKKK